MKFIFILAAVLCASFAAVLPGEECCKTGMITLQADNGKFVSWETVEFDDDEGGNESYVAETIQATKSRLDSSCVFKVENVDWPDDNKVLFRADNNKFLCRMDHEEDFQPIEARNATPELSCFFDVFNQPDGTVALRADNGKYLSRVFKYGINLIVAEKDSIDESSKFRFMQLS